MPQIKPIQNFAHAPSRRAFMIGKVTEVSAAAAAEFIAAGLAVAVEPVKTEPKPEVKTEKKSKEVA